MTVARIAAVETLLHEEHPHVVHVLVEDTSGAVGLGETFHNAETVAEYVHSTLAPVLVGEPAENVARLRLLLGSPVDGRQPFPGLAGVESSAASALDIACWDLRAKRLGLPLAEALGGRVRDRIRTYNTCAGGDHLPPEGTSRHLRGGYDDWGIGRGDAHADDFQASLERPGELAAELLAEGITAMKVFPFGRVAALTGGLSITHEQLEEQLEIFRGIREAVGDAMDVAVDFENAWTLAPALRIARALDEFGLLWLEDVLPVSAVDSLARLARSVRTPVAGNDYRAGLASYVFLVEAGAVSIVRLDVQWVGGVSEAVRIAAYAAARGLAVVLHDCAGPVQWAASAHCSLHVPNVMLQESVRAYYRGVYPRMATGLPEVAEGHIVTGERPGHGAELVPAYVAGARRRRSAVRDGRFVTESSPA